MPSSITSLRNKYRKLLTHMLPYLIPCRNFCTPNPIQSCRRYKCTCSYMQLTSQAPVINMCSMLTIFLVLGLLCAHYGYCQQIRQHFYTSSTYDDVRSYSAVTSWRPGDGRRAPGRLECAVTCSAHDACRYFYVAAHDDDDDDDCVFIGNSTGSLSGQELTSYTSRPQPEQLIAVKHATGRMGKLA